MGRVGLNSIRIPIGYWVVSPTDEPGAPRTCYPFLRGRGLGYLDDIVACAATAKISVILDLHGAPGSQNGVQTGGFQSSKWHHDDFDIDESVDAARLCARARDNDILDIEPYRKLGRNQIRIATFSSIEPSDVEALTACLDWLLENRD